MTKVKRNFFKEPSRYGTYEGPRQGPNEWREAFKQSWDEATCKKIVADEDEYTILGIQPGMAWEEIKKIFRGLMKKHHAVFAGLADKDEQEQVRKMIAAYTLLEGRYK